jgi:hypothetical protein
MEEHYPHPRLTLREARKGWIVENGAELVLTKWGEVVAAMEHIMQIPTAERLHLEEPR